MTGAGHGFPSVCCSCNSCQSRLRIVPITTYQGIIMQGPDTHSLHREALMLHASSLILLPHKWSSLLPSNLWNGCMQSPKEDQDLKCP